MHSFIRSNRAFCVQVLVIIVYAYVYMSWVWHGLEMQLIMMPDLFFVQNHYYLLNETVLSRYLPSQTIGSRRTSAGMNLER